MSIILCIQNFGSHITALPIIICSAILIWGTMSALGFFVSSFLSHTRNIRQLISFITVLIAVLPPVFYSIYPLPPEIRYLGYVFQQNKYQLQFNI